MLGLKRAMNCRSRTILCYKLRTQFNCFFFRRVSSVVCGHRDCGHFPFVLLFMYEPYHCEHQLAVHSLMFLPVLGGGGGGGDNILAGRDGRHHTTYGRACTIET